MQFESLIPRRPSAVRWGWLALPLGLGSLAWPAVGWTITLLAAAALVIGAARRQSRWVQPSAIRLDGHVLSLQRSGRTEYLDLWTVRRQRLLVTRRREVDRWYYGLVLDSGLVVSLFEQGTYQNETELLVAVARVTGMRWLSPRRQVWLVA